MAWSNVFPIKDSVLVLNCSVVNDMILDGHRHGGFFSLTGFCIVLKKSNSPHSSAGSAVAGELR
jgi:hypothetical protein